MKLEFWFEFGSTYSYPSAMRVESLAANKNIEVVWRSFLLGPIFKDQGWNNSPFNLYPAKGKYMWRDLERICEEQNIPFKRPSVFPRNGLLAARIACFYADADWLPKFVQSVYQGNFAHDLDISNTDLIADCLENLNLDSSHIIEEASSEQSKALLREQTERAIELELFGAPMFVIGKERFWGNDRLEAAIKWAEKQGSLPK